MKALQSYETRVMLQQSISHNTGEDITLQYEIYYCLENSASKMEMTVQDKNYVAVQSCLSEWYHRLRSVVDQQEITNLEKMACNTVEKRLFILNVR
jgi:hypothetical protein